MLTEGNNKSKSGESTDLDFNRWFERAPFPNRIYKNAFFFGSYERNRYPNFEAYIKRDDISIWILELKTFNGLNTLWEILADAYLGIGGALFIIVDGYVERQAWNHPLRRQTRVRHVR